MSGAIPGLGRRQEPETREKIRLSRIGKKHTDETRAKIKATVLANPQPVPPPHPCRGMTRQQRYAFDRIAERIADPAPRRPTIRALLAAGMIERYDDGAFIIPIEKMLAWRRWAAWRKRANAWGRTSASGKSPV